jgi:5-methylcytosine-specific restriction endonuclease McrA
MSKETKESKLRRYARFKAKAFKLLGGECVVCGSKEDLQFDHKNPSEKSFGISANWDRAWSVIRKELKKCQLLCRTHHLQKTTREQTGPRLHGTLTTYSRGKCRCDACRTAFNEWKTAWRLRTGRTKTRRGVAQSG